MRKTKKVHHDFFHTWTAAMAYTLGFFVADGTMTYHKRGGEYIAFHNTDKKLLVDIRRMLGSNHTIAARVRDVRWKVGFRIQIGSMRMCADLRMLGLYPNKSNTVRLPRIPDAFVGEFVRGYFDGDGCVYFNTLPVKDRKNQKHILQTKFTSGSKNLLKDLLVVLRAHGVCGGYIVNKKHGYELALSHADSLAIYHIMYNNAPTCGVYLARKKKKFAHAFHTMYGMRV